MKRKNAPLGALLTAALCACLTLSAAAQTFPDVPRTHWAYANIEEAASDGAVKGYQDGSFAPGNPLSLAHFTVILTRSFYGDELDRIPANLSGTWYGAAESVARSRGLLAGVDADMNDPLSRYQMAVEIRNLLAARGLTFSESAARESAASIRDWNAFPSYDLRNAVACVYSLGILGGYADGAFHGENILNRAQAAAIYCRVKNILANFAPSASDDWTPVDDSGANDWTPVDNSGANDWTPVDNSASNDWTPVDNSGADDWTPVDNSASNDKTPGKILKDLLEGNSNDRENILHDWTPVDGSEGKTPGEILQDLRENDNQPETVSDEAQAFREEVLRLVNEARAKEGLGALTLSDKLVEAAQIRAEELPDTLSHTRPDGSSCFTVLSEVGVGYMATGENIAAGQPTPADVMDSWMNSSGHRANILSKNYGQLGVGVCKASGVYGVYWVQLFTD